MMEAMPTHAQKQNKKMNFFTFMKQFFFKKKSWDKCNGATTFHIMAKEKIYVKLQLGHLGIVGSSMLVTMTELMNG